MKRVRGCIVALALLVLWIARARAASLQITPVRLRLGSDQNATVLTLRNPGEAPLYARVRAFCWRQLDGDDRLEEQKDLVVSPPVTVIAPGGEQLVRLVRINHSQIDHEQTFRLLIDEQPAAPPQVAESAVEIRLQYSVPVFVDASAGETAPRLQWTLARQNGAWYLTATNAGTLHAQLSAVQLERLGGARFTVSEGLLGYALAGSTHVWRLPAEFAPPLDGSLFLHLLVNGQPSDGEVQVLHPALVPDSRKIID